MEDSKNGKAWYGDASMLERATRLIKGSDQLVKESTEEAKSSVDDMARCFTRV